MISPSLGRIVWYTPCKHGVSGLATESDGRCAAIVVKVWSDRLVNLTVFDANGNSHAKTSVKLLQSDDESHADGHFCEWMPYQKGQAQKAESLEKQLASK